MKSTSAHSLISLGTMQFLWTTTRDEAVRILDAYVDLGGNSLDTANVYTNWAEGLHGGEAESIIGDWLAQNQSKRDKVRITSKVGSQMWPGDDGGGLSKAHLQKALHDSLARLQTDYLDMYMIHAFDPQTPLEETLETMQGFLDAGVIKAIGFSNFTAEQTKSLFSISRSMRIPMTHMQVYYNLVNRHTFEQQYVPLLKEYPVQIYTYGSLASGFLTGAYRPNSPLPNHARSSFAQALMTDQNMHILSVLDSLARKYNKTVAQISLAWLLSQPMVSGAIIGADSVQQLQQNFIDHLDWLHPDDISLLSEASSAT